MFVNCGGVGLFVQDVGQGEPLVFVHGWMMSHEVWKEQVSAFRGRYRIVALDLRGFGESRKPEGNYSIDIFCQDLATVLSALRVDKPVLVGWSMGASVAMVYAATRPEDVSKVVLVDGTPLLVATEDFPYAMPQDAARQFLDHLQADFPQTSRAFVELMFPEPDSGLLKEWIYGITQQTTKSIAMECLVSAGTQDLRPYLKQIKAPTLVCYGEEDRVCLPDASRFMATEIPDSRLIVFPGKGHAPFLTDVSAFNGALEAFLLS